MDKIYLKDKYFNVPRIAITSMEQNKGLMFEPSPTPIMIFPYKKSSVRKFWMHNTISPLDIIFCNDNKIIKILQGKPLSTNLIGPDEPANLVVELPHGTSNSLLLEEGDHVSFHPTLETMAKILLEGVD